MSRKAGNGDTKHNILMAASEVFADKGYKGTTIREIAGMAKVNVAAVNYHYGDKEQLYMAVMRYWVRDAFENSAFRIAEDESRPPMERLKDFIHSTLVSMMGEDGQGTGFGRLITLEASFCPTDMLKQIVSESIAGPARSLLKIVKELMGDEGSESKVRFYSACIVGQTVYFYMCRNITNELFQLYPSPENLNLEELTDYIYEFSIHAIEGGRG